MEDLLVPITGLIGAAVGAAISWARIRTMNSAQQKLADALKDHFKRVDISNIDTAISALRADLDNIALAKTPNQETSPTDLIDAFNKLNRRERAAFVEKLTRETERAKDALAKIIVRRALN